MADSSDSTDWTKVLLKCPECGKEKPVVPDFGIMTLGEHPPSPQFRCNVCRIAIVTSQL